MMCHVASRDVMGGSGRYRKTHLVSSGRFLLRNSVVVYRFCIAPVITLLPGSEVDCSIDDDIVGISLEKGLIMPSEHPKILLTMPEKAVAELDEVAAEFAGQHDRPNRSATVRALVSRHLAAKRKSRKKSESRA